MHKINKILIKKYRSIFNRSYLDQLWIFFSKQLWGASLLHLLKSEFIQTVPERNSFNIVIIDQ